MSASFLKSQLSTFYQNSLKNRCIETLNIANTLSLFNFTDITILKQVLRAKKQNRFVFDLHYLLFVFKEKGAAVWGGICQSFNPRPSHLVRGFVFQNSALCTFNRPKVSFFIFTLPNATELALVGSAVYIFQS